MAVTIDRGDQLFRQGVDDRRTDAVETAGMNIAAVLAAELAAGVERGQQQFEAGLFVFRVHGDRDAAAIIADGDRIAAFVQRDVDVVGMAVEVFVDGVIDDFPNEMMQALLFGVADIHGRPFADRFEAFENLNLFDIVRFGGCGHGVSVPGDCKVARGDIIGVNRWAGGSALGFV